MRSATSAILCLAAGLFAPGRAGATEVQGRIVVRGTLPQRADPATKRPPYYWSLENGALPARDEAIVPDRDLTLVFAERGRPAGRRPSEPVVVRISEGGMSPSSMVVRPGARIQFENDDAFSHELYSPSLPSFEPQAMVRGQTRVLIAPPSGLLEIRCKRTPHLRGFIAILDATHIVTPTPGGSFTVTVDPGTYTVRTFYEGRWLPDSEVSINEGRAQVVEIQIDASTARPRAPTPSSNPAPGAPPPGPQG